MNSPLISIKTLIVGAAIFGIIMAVAIIFGTLYPGGSISETVNSPVVVASTSVPIQTTSSVSTTIAVATTTATISSSTQTKSPPETPSQKITLILVVTPSQIIEGDPVMITINEAAGTTTSTESDDAIIENIKKATLTAARPNMPGRSATASLQFVDYANKPRAFYGTGINQTPGKATVTVTMKDGTKLTANFTIGERVSPTENLPVPAQLGGNSTSSQEQLVVNLDAENAELANVYSNSDTSFWTSAFGWPIHPTDVTGGIVVTDPFGYERDSGAETIIHKGTDFKAPPGTPVYAINAGFVRVTQLFSVYGNTVIVDHGMGIQSFYMHLSKMVVTPGEAVKQGQLLGYSGETGYSEGPHLHLTIRIGGISIDPMVFYGFFGLKPDSVTD